jgi:hypothetical protein
MHSLQLSVRHRRNIKLYHRTTEDSWAKIQEEGVLWGVTNSYRYTYLSPEDVGESFGSVLLEVDYTPVGSPVDNYGFNPPSEEEYCWQFSVFDPIPITLVRRVQC